MVSGFQSHEQMWSLDSAPIMLYLFSCSCFACLNPSWIYDWLKEHLMEEERDIPPLAREHFTEQDEAKIVEKIGKEEANLKVLRNLFPAIMEAMASWGTPAQREKFESNFPGPLRHLAKKYWYPDYETFVKPKRDAPFLEAEPLLQRVGCFGISFCFPCII